MSIQETLMRYIKLSSENSMTSPDVMAIVKELREKLVGGIIDNIYQDGKRIGFKIRSKAGKWMLLLEPEVRVHVTNVSYPWFATNFIMMVRKHLVDRKIGDVLQHKFDRIFLLRVDNYLVVAEILKRGNFIVVRDGKVLFALEHVHMRDRAIYPGAEFAFPPGAPEDPRKLSEQEFREKLMSGKDIFRGLLKLGLGRKYTYEVLFIAQIDPGKKPDSLTEEELKRLFEAVKNVLDRVEKIEAPSVYLKENTPIYFSPIRLKFAEEIGLKRVEFSSFSEALDYYFSKLKAPAKEDELEKLRKEREKLLKRLEAQRKRIEELKAEIGRLEGIVEKIYENYQLLSDALIGLRRAKLEKDLDWDEIRKKVDEAKSRGLKSAQIIEEIRDDGTFVVKLNGERVVLDIHKSIEDVVQEIYEQIKKAKEKIKRAEEEAKKVEEELESLEEKLKQAEEEAKIIVREPIKQWYMSYNWFLSSDGLLVVGGRDAKSNEALVKKHLGEGDLFLHAEIHGGSAVVIKAGGKEVPERTLMEAAVLAASYSKAWQKGLTAVDVFWTPHDKVSLTPPSGQYLAKGAFIIKEKHYIKNVPLRLAIGLVVRRIDERTVEVFPVSGPESAVSKLTNLYVVIVPGKLSKSETAKLILKKLEEKARGDPVLLKALHSLKVERIIELVPGPSAILEGSD